VGGGKESQITAVNGLKTSAS